LIIPYGHERTFQSRSVPDLHLIASGNPGAFCDYDLFAAGPLRENREAMARARTGLGCRCARIRRERRPRTNFRPAVAKRGRQRLDAEPDRVGLSCRRLGEHLVAECCSLSRGSAPLSPRPHASSRSSTATVAGGVRDAVLGQVPHGPATVTVPLAFRRRSRHCARVPRLLASTCWCCSGTWIIMLSGTVPDGGASLVAWPLWLADAWCCAAACASNV